MMELMMAEKINWRTEGVKVVRAETLRKGTLESSSAGRATAFEFAGGGGPETWIGTVTLLPHAKTGPHHHGRHEVAVYVAKGRAQIRWGEQLEFAAEVSPGDFVYFAPYVPHQEVNLASDTLDFVVIRSDKERIAVGLDIVPVARPEQVKCW
jgi:uncharacterized RmlC-like cupin family protein